MLQMGALKCNGLMLDYVVVCVLFLAYSSEYEKNVDVFLQKSYCLVH